MPPLIEAPTVGLAEKEVVGVPDLDAHEERAAGAAARIASDVNGPAGTLRHRHSRVFDNPQVRVGLIMIAAVLVEVVLARTVLDVKLNFFALLAPFFVFTAYKVSGERGRTAEIVASAGVVVAAAVVLLVYAL